MRNDTACTEAGRQYAAAHAAQDLHKALERYRGVMAAHPYTPEAEYSRTQIQNIVKSVVPKQEFLDAQVKLALAHIEHELPPDVEHAPVMPGVEEKTVDDRQRH